MFTTKNAHTPYFAPSDYSDATTHRAELVGVFARSWSVIAAAEDLAEHGAQVAVEVGDVPVVVRNDRGTLRAFRNVCPHRHSLIVAEGPSCAHVLKCQYHGWEFGADGKLSHLPDGASFRGWKAKDVRLPQLRCEVAFGLVFVNPTPGESALRDDFGAITASLEDQFAGQALHWIQVTEHDVNWKVVVENAVESYHVPMVHPGTFGTYQDEKLHRHLVEPSFTQYHDLNSSDVRPLRWHLLDRAMFERQRLHGYTHTHVFPNHLVTYAGFYREWVVVEPLGPRRCRRVGYGFLPGDVRKQIPLGGLLVREMARRTRIGADRILAEDSSVWPSVQRGSEASRFEGVLSAREERVTAFQRWVVERRAPTP